MNHEVPPKVLLVEGSDDEHVVRHIWQCHSENLPFTVEGGKGIDPLLDSIGPQLIARSRRTLGILADANDNPIGRWQKIVHRIQRDTKIQMPRNPKKNGTIVSNTEHRIGIWLMPDNLSPGELEDFIYKLIPEDDPIWPRTNQYIKNIPSKERKFTDRKEHRAKIHAWLATRKKPRRMGAAIGAGDLDSSAPIAQDFYKWLHLLFNETVSSSTN